MIIATSCAPSELKVDPNMSPAYLSLALGDVQRFISDARSTSDLAAGSAVMSWLAAKVIDELAGSSCEVILPSPTGSTGIPNRIWARLPNWSPKTAQAVEGAVKQKAEELFESANLPRPEGFPEVRWVLIGESGGETYAELWARAREALDARKRIRAFDPYQGSGDGLCSSCGRWEVTKNPPLDRTRLRRGEELCAACALKRAVGSRARSPGALNLTFSPFPSTAGIASAPYRAGLLDGLPGNAGGLRSLLDALDELDQHADLQIARVLAGAIPTLERKLSTIQAGNGERELAERLLAVDGAWCYPDNWQLESIEREHQFPAGTVSEALVERGRRAAAELTGGAGPSPYLAVFLQDADRMGRALGGQPNPFGGTPQEPDEDFHAKVSGALAAIGESLRVKVEDDARGRLVYSGGDDLLAFLPVEDALGAARACRDAVIDTLPGAEVSASITFFHHSYPLQEALRRARQALDEAKELGRGRLALRLLRRGGERARVALRWRLGKNPAEAVDLIAQAFRDGLSPGLIHDVSAECEGFRGLGRARIGSELCRLCRRHGKEDAAQVIAACDPEDGGPGISVDVLNLAHFISSQSGQQS